MTVSRIGSWIDFIGLNLYVYNTFGSGKILGTFLMARMLPSILFGPLGGYISDHYSRRNIMIICDTARAFLVIGFIFTKDLFTFFAIGIMLSAIDKIYTAANNAFLPDIVEKEELMEANSIIKMTASTVTILGAMAGGIIVSSLNFSWIFIIDSITFIFSIISILLQNLIKALSVVNRHCLFTTR
jgi:MFS family permease